MISDQWDSTMPPLNLWNFAQRDKYVYNTDTIMELYHLRSLDDPLTKVIKDDPVRPHIPLSQRINDTAEILILKAGEEILAATCLQWLKDIPEDEQDLIENLDKSKDTAVFYTIWSYSPGAGAMLLKQAAEWILGEFKDVKQIVTLSPQTEMAKRFHLKNGATIHKENPTSVNYKYYQAKND